MADVFDTIDNFFEHLAKEEWGVALEVFAILYCFFALAIVCDEHLAPALETLCIKWGIREDVAGATFLAFGSAAPEIVINAVTTIKSQVTDSNSTSLGISAIIGSGMIAFSFIPSMCSFFSELELKLKRRPLLRDELFYAGALFSLCVAFSDGKITLIESVYLMAVYFGYLAVVITSSWFRQQYRHKIKGIPLKEDESFVYKARKQLEYHRSQSNLGASTPQSHSSIPRPSPLSRPQTPLPGTPLSRDVISPNNKVILNQSSSSSSQRNSMISPIHEHRYSVSDRLEYAPLNENDNDMNLDNNDNNDKNENTDNKRNINVKSKNIANINLNMDDNDISTSKEQLLLNRDDENDETEKHDKNEMNEHKKKKKKKEENNVSTNNKKELIKDKITHALLGDDDDILDEEAEKVGVRRHSIIDEMHMIEGEEEDDDTILGKIVYIITLPLRILFTITCPAAGEGERFESLYFVTFAITIIWVAFFSFMLSSIVQAWVNAWGMPQALFGMLLIAIGAEIPDTIESVTMAKKGYGSMAVANCQGTQVINIGIGLGLPWFITNCVNTYVEIDCHILLEIGAIFQAAIVGSNLFLLLGLAVIQRQKKAELKRWKAFALIVIYFAMIAGYTAYVYTQGYFNGCN